MRLVHLFGLTSATLFAAACGGDDGGSTVDAPGGDGPWFPTPTAVTKANMNSGGVWTEIGDADWTCLNTPSSDQPSTQSITLTGKIRDFQTDSGVAAANITVFPGINLSQSIGTPSPAVSSSAGDATKGDYTVTLGQLPSGQTRYGFKIVETNMYVTTYLINQYFDPADNTQSRDISAVSKSTATALPAFIGVTRDPTKGVLAGAFRDCAGREVSNAVVTVSSVAGQPMHLPGEDPYYFSAGSTSLPVRHNQSPTMNKDGLFVILNIPPQTAPAYVQIWGFRTQAELTSGQMTLLSELASPVESDVVITGSFEPKRQ